MIVAHFLARDAIKLYYMLLILFYILFRNRVIFTIYCEQQVTVITNHRNDRVIEYTLVKWLHSLRNFGLFPPYKLFLIRWISWMKKAPNAEPLCVMIGPVQQFHIYQVPSQWFSNSILLVQKINEKNATSPPVRNNFLFKFLVSSFRKSDKTHKNILRPNSFVWWHLLRETYSTKQWKKYSDCY